MFLRLGREKHKFFQGYRYVIGCDEVGRGSLAGPVVAAAVILDFFNKDFITRRRDWLAEIRDSKQLSPIKRSTLARLIRQEAVGWGIGVVDSAVIDKINIHQASLRAMKLAVMALERKVPFETLGKMFVFVDGKFIIPGLKYNQEAVVGGDALIVSLSAASIVAKVYRDNLMIKLDRKYPDYTLAQHKGYGTTQHIDQIQRFGLSPIHRVSYCDNIV